MTDNTPEWAAEEREHKARMDDETWADQYLDDDDDYMTRKEMDLP